MLGDFALRVNAKDNVAINFQEMLKKAASVVVRDPSGNETTYTAQDDIPFGHKIATVQIRAGEPVVKYGEVIGRASREIGAGEHVHVHNMDSCRGRGDLQARGEGEAHA